LPHTAILATTILPSLRSGQIPLDEADQAWQHRSASVASLRRLIGLPPESLIAFSGILNVRNPVYRVPAI